MHSHTVRGVTPTDVEIGIRESLRSRDDRWSVNASLAPDGWKISLTHPASAGLIIETGTVVEHDAVEIARRVIASSTEIDIASAAPALEHLDLLLGLRTVAKAFGWQSREVGAVAFLLFENGLLTLDETAWLAGYEGIEAPMRPQSPHG